MTERIKKLLERAIVTDLSEKELKELYILLNEEESENDLKSTLYIKWSEAASTSGKVNSEKLFNSLMDRIGINNNDIIQDELLLKELQQSGKSLKRKLISLIPYAAIIVLAFFTTLFVIDRNKKEYDLVNQDMNNVVTPYGSRTYLELTDGTKVWLNSGSKLSYPGKFGGESRSINIEGEAYFEVAYDAGKPFIVHTSNIDIVVLGTRFNLKSYPDEETIVTTLIAGSIKIIPTQTSLIKGEIILNPNERATYDKIYNRIEIDNIAEVTEIKKPVSKNATKEVIVKNEAIISWKDEQLVFQRESLYEMAKKLERWYGMKIIIDKGISETDTYSGKFMNNETIYQVLEAISAINPIQTEVKGTTIYVKPGEKMRKNINNN